MKIRVCGWHRTNGAGIRQAGHTGPAAPDPGARGSDRAETKRCPRGPARPSAPGHPRPGSSLEPSLQLIPVRGQAGDDPRSSTGNTPATAAFSVQVKQNRGRTLAGRPRFWPPARHIPTGRLGPQTQGPGRRTELEACGAVAAPGGPAAAVQPPGSPAGVEEAVADPLICCFRFCLQTGRSLGSLWTESG